MEDAVSVITTDRYGLEENINNIGYENVLQILPSNEYDGTLFVIIYREYGNVRNNNL